MVFKHKDIQAVFNCSERTAYKHMADIREHFGIRIITGFHVAEYLHINIDQLQYYYLTKVKGVNSDIAEVSERLKKQARTGRYYTRR